MTAPIAEIAEVGDAILTEIERAVVGKRDVLELVLAGILADGHVLLEDLPGVAKTLTARSFAQVTGLGYSRVQFTPDLVPGDITGSQMLDRETNSLVFHPGPLFANLVLGDEINRAPPKTQSAILEAMEERQVTVDGTSHQLPRPFVVIATQNPIESEGTYPLPEAQLDRFLIRVRVGYPGTEAEKDILRQRISRRTDGFQLSPVTDAAGLVRLQQGVEDVFVDESVLDYVVTLVEATRSSSRTEAGASPRGSLALLKAARARAALRGRDFVSPDDVKQLAVPTLGHRVLLTPEEWVRGVVGDQVVSDLLGEVPTPETVAR